jgi:hypothetical protein
VVYIHVEYYSVIKKNEIMSPAGGWMQLEVIIFSKISQIQEDKYGIHNFSHMWIPDFKKTKESNPSPPIDMGSEYD